MPLRFDATLKNLVERYPADFQAGLDLESAELEREAPADQARELLTATFVLSGLRVKPETAINLFKG